MYCTYSFREALCITVLGRHCVMYLQFYGGTVYCTYSFREALCTVLTVLGRCCVLYLQF